MRITLILALLIAMSLCNAQSKMTKGEKRFKFAEGTLGFDMQFTPPSGKLLLLSPEDEIQEHLFPSSITPRFTISGLHFWGHADFYITLPIANLLSQKIDENSVFFTSGAETGAKIYPWRIKENRFAPFVGISWNLSRFHLDRTETDRTSLLQSKSPLQFGVTYRKGDKLFEIGASRNFGNDESIYLDRSTQVGISTPALSYYLSYRWTFDSSLKDAKKYDDGTLQRQADYLRGLGKLSDFSFSIGLSSSLLLRNKLNETRAPFSDEMKITNSHLDLGIGYFFEKLDAHLNLSYRSMPYEVKSYDFTQQLKRQTIGLEIYKFLFDYHGFVPYIGIIPSYDKYNFVETNYQETSTSAKKNGFNTGLIFGWDIRQDDVQWYILRTNLRYFRSSLPIEGSTFSINQFEFNFIQFVYYPGRHKWIRSTRNKF